MNLHLGAPDRRETCADIRGEHLLLGLLRCDDGDANAVLAELDVTSENLRKATLQTIGRAA